MSTPLPIEQPKFGLNNGTIVERGEYGTGIWIRHEDKFHFFSETNLVDALRRKDEKAVTA
jgi:hypothetical protein